MGRGFLEESHQWQNLNHMQLSADEIFAMFFQLNSEKIQYNSVHFVFWSIITQLQIYLSKLAMQLHKYFYLDVTAFFQIANLSLKNNTMAAIASQRGFGNVFDHTMKECANCLVFSWSSKEITLQQCSRCKVLVYCDKQCQEEHWHLLHKRHCKKLAEVKAEERRTNPGLKQSSVSIFSHHPFPIDGLPGDIHERLILTLGRIIAKMRSTRHKAYTILKDQIDALECAVISAQRRIWATRKVYPKDFNNYVFEELLVPFNNFVNENQGSYINAKKSPFAKLDLWASLLLFVEEIVLMAAVTTPRFKQDVISKEQTDFLRRLEQLGAAGTRKILPTFLSFLEILCGGSLIQKCSFCHVATTIEALGWNGKGCNQRRFSTVVAKPHNPLVFCCRRKGCAQQLQDVSFDIIGKAFRWDQILESGSAMRCDNCYLLSMRVHR